MANSTVDLSELADTNLEQAVTEQLKVLKVNRDILSQPEAIFQTLEDTLGQLAGTETEQAIVLAVDDAMAQFLGYKTPLQYNVQWKFNRPATATELVRKL